MNARKPLIFGKTFGNHELPLVHGISTSTMYF